MSETKVKGEAKVADFTEVFKGLSGLVRENYLSNLKLIVSLWEENQKFASAQIEQFFTTQKEYAEQLKTASEKFLPKEVASLWNVNYSKVFDGSFDRIASTQKEYANLVKSVSERFTKDAVTLSQKTAEKAFSVFDEYLGLFKS
jgi:hypothetical protein